MMPITVQGPVMFVCFAFANALVIICMSNIILVLLLTYFQGRSHGVTNHDLPKLPPLAVAHSYLPVFLLLRELVRDVIQLIQCQINVYAAPEVIRVVHECFFHPSLVVPLVTDCLLRRILIENFKAGFANLLHSETSYIHPPVIFYFTSSHRVFALTVLFAPQLLPVMREITPNSL